LDKNLEINHIPARVGDNVEIKCDVTGTPPPPLVWRRYGADLEALSEPEVSSHAHAHARAHAQLLEIMPATKCNGLAASTSPVQGIAISAF
jgi:hypothetical protein